MLPLNVLLVEDDPAHALDIRRAFVQDNRTCAMRILEPFFTTKEVGKGSDPGLAMV